MLAAGSRCKLYGLNVVGLKRQGFPEETIKGLKNAYKIIFKSGLSLEKAIETIKNGEIISIPEVDHLVQFIEGSKRGICR